MKKLLFTGLWLPYMIGAFGQSNISGPVNISGPHNSGSLVTMSGLGTIAVSGNGNYYFGGVVNSTPRTIANAFSIGTGGTYSGTSATLFVDGYVSEVGSADFVFPVGDGSLPDGNVHTLGISALSTTATTVTSYNYSGTTTTPNNKSLDATTNNGLTAIDPSAYWTMSSSAANAVVTIAARDVTGVFATGSNLFITGYNVAAAQWQNLGTTPMSMQSGGQMLSSKSVDLSQFSNYAVGTNSPILPITLVRFVGVANGCTAKLTWQTATEVNSHHYEVQLATNGIDFTQVAEVKSNNSITGASYSFNYRLGNGGVNYFRLKAVDNDGKYTYSPIVQVSGTGACGTGQQVTVLPNPAANLINIIGLDGSKNMITLFDINGKKLAETTTTASTQNINISRYAKGVYIITIQAANGSVNSVKVVKQ